MGERICDFCPRWNDWLGKCDAPYWCPDKEKVNRDYYDDEEDIDEDEV